MKRLPHFLLLLIGVLASSQSRAQVGDSPATAANWEMKVFTKEGFRSLIMRGSEVRLGAANRYNVVDLSITIFSGQANAQVESILLSPAATYLARENRASGDKTIRLIRDEMEVTGEQWTYVHAEKRVTIQRNNRVVFHAALPDLIR